MNTIIEFAGEALLIHTPVIPDPTVISTVRIAADGAIVDLSIDSAVLEMAVEIWDMDAASWWLPSVLGASVTETALTAVLRRHADGPESGGTKGALTAEPDPDAPLLPILRRLALALWIRRWQPHHSHGVKHPLDPWLLDLEAGSLAVDAGSVLDPDQCLAEALLAPHLTRLAAEVVTILPPPSLGAERVQSVIVTAAEDALDQVEPSHLGWDALAEALRIRDQREAGIAEAVAGLERMLESAEPTGRSRTEVALTAGADSTDTRDKSTIPNSRDQSTTVTAEGQAPVDPRTVPARSIASGDGAIEWELTRVEDTVWRCDVTARADDPDTRTTAPLFATVDLGGYSDDAALEPTAHGYEATLWVHTDARLDGLPDVRVSVYGGIPDSDVMPNRPTMDRRADWTVIDRITEGRVRRIHRIGPVSDERRGGSGDWDAPFVFELERMTEPGQENESQAPQPVALVVTSRFDRYALAAASSDAAPKSLEVDEPGITVTYTSFSPNKLHVSVAVAAGLAHPHQVMHVTGVGTDGEFERFLVLLETSADTVSGGTTVVSDARSLDLEVRGPLRLGDIDEAALVTIEASVRSASPGERRGWIAAARLLPNDHPSRQAVLNGLR